MTEEKDLRAWKAEAIEVIKAWEEVGVALGSPGSLGQSKAEAAREEAQRLVARVAELETRQRLTYAQLTSIWNVGSGEWTWPEEMRRLSSPTGPHYQNFIEVFRDISVHGIKEPVLLGPDRRVWDGHHRIVIAGMHNISIPYTIGFGTGGS